MGASRYLKVRKRLRRVVESGACHYCGAVRNITLDHIVPKSRGGAGWSFNLAFACEPCNARKADQMPTCDCKRCWEAIILWQKYPDERRFNPQTKEAREVALAS